MSASPRSVPSRSGNTKPAGVEKLSFLLKIRLLRPDCRCDLFGPFELLSYRADRFPSRNPLHTSNTAWLTPNAVVGDHSREVQSLHLCNRSIDSEFSTQAARALDYTVLKICPQYS